MEKQSSAAITARAMDLLKAGKVRNHKLVNSSTGHSETEVKQEYQAFRDYLPTKLSRLVDELPGKSFL